MTIQKSDDFDGLGAGVNVNGRTLNNVLGGSGSWAWTGVTPVGATGGGAVALGGAGFGVNVGSAVDGKVRVKFRMATLTNILVGMLGTAYNRPHTSFGVIYVQSSSSLLLRQFDSGGGSLGNVDSIGSISLSTGTDYFIEIQAVNPTIRGRLFQSDGITQIGARDLTYTPGTWPSGNYISVEEYFGGGTGVVDDFTYDDAAGGGAAGGLVLMGAFV